MRNISGLIGASQICNDNQVLCQPLSELTIDRQNEQNIKYTIDMNYKGYK